jgi:Protein of unknown function (DUF4007)
LKKGYDAAAEDRAVFTREDAPLRLGVGKNMARSIRYWCHAFKLLDEVAASEGRASHSIPSMIGGRLLGEWDPYLEDLASLWYLHWKLVEGPCLATAWKFVFTAFPEREMTADLLVGALESFVTRNYPAARIAPSSLRKDVHCILRMYGHAPVAGGVTEDNIQCPFAELGLLRPGQDGRTYAFDMGEKTDLPDAVVLAASLEYAAAAVPGARTIALGRLLFDWGSPGMAFKLTETALCAAAERVAANTGLVALSDTAGLVQISFTGDPLDTALQLLASYYPQSVVEGES